MNASWPGRIACSVPSRRKAAMRSRDYEEFLESLNANGVRYLVVGAHAVAFHARPRATKDLDILIDPSPSNAERVLKAIRDFFGGADLGFEKQDLIEAGSIVQLGVAPVQFDLLSSLTSLKDFQTAWSHRVAGKYGDTEAFFISLADLLAEKEQTGRMQDRVDAASLRRARDRQRG